MIMPAPSPHGKRRQTPSNSGLGYHEFDRLATRHPELAAIDRRIRNHQVPSSRRAFHQFFDHIDNHLVRIMREALARDYRIVRLHFGRLADDVADRRRGQR